jgi:hypothetical protein
MYIIFSDFNESSNVEKDRIVLFAYREAWLAPVIEYFEPDFKAHSYPFHAQVRVTCGWLSRGGFAPK